MIGIGCMRGGMANNPVTALAQQLEKKTVTFAATETADVDTQNLVLVALGMPVTGWTAASITFLVPRDGLTDGLSTASSHWSVYEFNATLAVEKEIVVANARFIFFNPADWGGLSYIRLRSGTEVTPVDNSGVSVDLFFRRM